MFSGCNGISEMVHYPLQRWFISFVFSSKCKFTIFIHLFFNTCRLFGMTGVIRTNSSDPYTLALHPFVSWPDFVNPLVVLLLYFTLVVLLHKWVHITEEVCAKASVCQGKSE